jgi:hypothetical protein
VSVVEKASATKYVLFDFIMEPTQASAICFTASRPIDRIVCRCSFLGRWAKWALSVPDGVLPRQLPKQRLGATGRTAAQVLMASIGLYGAISWAVEGIRRIRTSQGTAYGNVSSVSAIHGRKRRTPRSEVAHPLSEGVASLVSGLLRLTEQR